MSISNRKIIASRITGDLDWSEEYNLGWRYIVWVNSNRRFFKSYKNASLYYDKQKQSKNWWEYMVIELIYKEKGA